MSKAKEITEQILHICKVQNSDVTYIAKKAIEEIDKDLEELERWRKGEFIIVPARHSGKTPYHVLAAKVLDKYMMAFDILKDKLNLRTFYVEDEYFCNRKYALHSDGTVILEKEEYELLKELLEVVKNENFIFGRSI